MTTTRRRLLTITAAATAGLLFGPPARAETRAIWGGTALGARAVIRIDHPDADSLVAEARDEIARLEGIFSLFQPDSQLSRLNRDGQLLAPAFELLDCLAVAGAVHHATGGRFDPTIQPLWAAWAEAAVLGLQPDAATLAALPRGWPRVSVQPDAVRLLPGVALSLNGIAQGYVADRVAALFQARGLDDILIDTGELRALDGRDWPVTLAETGAKLTLRNRALASSAPLGTTFDEAGRQSHILDPITGKPVAPLWRQIAISAPSAAVADAFSTAACLMSSRAEIAAAAARLPGVQIETATLFDAAGPSHVDLL